MNLLRPNAISLSLIFASLILIGGYIGYGQITAEREQLVITENHITALEERLVRREEILAEIRLLKAGTSSRSLLIEGATPAIAAARLQGQAARIVEESEGFVDSARIIRSVPMAPFVEVGVAIELSTTIEGLRDILYKLDASVPATIITSIDISSNRNDTRELTVRLEIKGYSSQPEA